MAATTTLRVPDLRPRSQRQSYDGMPKGRVGKNLKTVRGLLAQPLALAVLGLLLLLHQKTLFFLLLLGVAAAAATHLLLLLLLLLLLARPGVLRR